MLTSTDPIINAFSAYKIVGLPSFLAEKYLCGFGWAR